VGFLEGVPLGAVLNGSGWVVAFWVTLFSARMVLTGALVPRATHEDTVKALEIERQRNDILSGQQAQITDSLETVEAFVKALPQPQLDGQQRRELPPGRRGGR
jgi:hypothetical protein